MLGELETVLSRPNFAKYLSPEDKELALLTLRIDAEVVGPRPCCDRRCGHQEDDLVFSAAVSGNADYLVTGDAEFLRVGEYQGVKLATPAEFLQVLESHAD